MTSQMYKLQYLKDGKWETWVPLPAPWENHPFGESLQRMLVLEGIIELGNQFPTRVIPILIFS